jgi:hypothetical protein
MLQKYKFFEYSFQFSKNYYILIVIHINSMIWVVTSLVIDEYFKSEKEWIDQFEEQLDRQLEENEVAFVQWLSQKSVECYKSS